MKKILSIALFLGALSCTNKNQNAQSHRLQDDLERLQKQATVLDDQIKNSSTDRERQMQYISQKELLKSRMERLKAQLGSFAP